MAGAGVVLAAVYMIRLYQRSMHNPLGEGAESREMTRRRRLAVLVPIVAVILALALYPQFVLKRTEPSTRQRRSRRSRAATRRTVSSWRRADDSPRR